MKEVDQRITLAQEYLASLREQRVESLPPSVLMRECAELRHQLGQVLAVIEGQGEGSPLTDEQRTTVLEALNDAARWRDHKGAEECFVCAREPGGLCHRHAADLDRADGYRRVFHELSGEL